MNPVFGVHSRRDRTPPAGAAARRLRVLTTLERRSYRTTPWPTRRTSRDRAERTSATSGAPTGRRPTACGGRPRGTRGGRPRGTRGGRPRVTTPGGRRKTAAAEGRARGAGRDSAFADEVALDFPSMDGLVDGIRAAFFAPANPDAAATHTTHVALTPRQADRGAQVPLAIEVRHTCPLCGGRGELPGARCGVCRGAGSGLLPPAPCGSASRPGCATAPACASPSPRPTRPRRGSRFASPFTDPGAGGSPFVRGGPLHESDGRSDPCSLRLAVGAC